MAETKVGKVVAIGAALILVMVWYFAVSFLLATLFGLPFSFNLPIAARLVGGALVLAGLAVMARVFKHRGPSNVMVSTYVTLTKVFRRTPVAEKAGRTEPLIVDGPQKYVRNPMYFGEVVMVLGLAVLTAHTFVFIATIIILLWFSLVIIPFEERELSALFGDGWKRYSEETPMLFPFTKRKRRADAHDESDNSQDNESRPEVGGLSGEICVVTTDPHSRRRRRTKLSLDELREKYKVDPSSHLRGHSFGVAIVILIVGIVLFMKAILGTVFGLTVFLCVGVN